MKLDRYIPNMYKKNIFDIDYKLLKSKGIKCIIFDLDNTLLVFSDNIIPTKTLRLIKELKKDFDVVVMSNNFKSRISNLCKVLEVDFVSFSIKPLSLGFNKVKKKFKHEDEEFCIVGDQLMSDILGGNKVNFMTILVDPLSDKDLKITKINRILEKKVFNRLKDRGILERGKYYELR